MAMANNIVENIPDEVDLFAPMLQQSIITDDYDQEYLPVNYIQPGEHFEFSIKCADNFYLDLEESRFIVTSKINKARGPTGRQCLGSADQPYAPLDVSRDQRDSE